MKQIIPFLEFEHVRSNKPNDNCFKQVIMLAAWRSS